VPRYKVVAHRRVLKFLKGLDDEGQKKTLMEAMENLERYPVSLREMDATTIRGAEKTFRIRVGRYRVVFVVDKEESTIYVTHLDTRKKVYK
jgi:mRNA-degrading endonuclease RelE of RelBE toxin-antitoxin system